MASEMPNRLCTYIVRQDTGLAPNPYWDFCTLAVCTPNHQGIRLEAGDWIAGFLDKSQDYRFLYAMEISEVLNLDTYFHDPRFEAKKPGLSGSWMERCGDNFYSLRKDGSWRRHRNRFHLSKALKIQDTRHAKVFIGTRFWYRGRAAEPAPRKFGSLVGGRGARVNHDPTLACAFSDWVIREFRPGVADLPNDNPDIS